MGIIGFFQVDVKWLLPIQVTCLKQGKYNFLCSLFQLDNAIFTHVYRCFHLHWWSMVYLLGKVLISVLGGLGQKPRVL